MQKHIAQFFKFLEDKEGKPIPLKFKFLYPQTWGKPTKKDLKVNGDLNLSGTNIKELPEGLEVYGILRLTDCTSLEKLPEGLKVEEHLNLTDCTSLKELPQGLKVGGSLSLKGCTSLKKLPQGLKVGDSLILSGCTSLEKLPQGLKVDVHLFLRNTPVADKYTEEEIKKIIEDGDGYVKGAIIT